MDSQGFQTLFFFSFSYIVVQYIGLKLRSKILFRMCILLPFLTCAQNTISSKSDTLLSQKKSVFDTFFHNKKKALPLLTHDKHDINKQIRGKKKIAENKTTVVHHEHKMEMEIRIPTLCTPDRKYR